MNSKKNAAMHINPDSTEAAVGKHISTETNNSTSAFAERSNAQKPAETRPAGVVAVSHEHGIEIAFPTNFERDFGIVAWLIGKGETAQNWTAADLVRLVVPPIHLKQCLIFRKYGAPFGFVSWAHLNATSEEGFVQGTRRLQPTDWNAGDRLWIMDAIFPFGGLWVIKSLRPIFFVNKSGKFMRRKKDGARKVYNWYGHNLASSQNCWWRAAKT